MVPRGVDDCQRARAPRRDAADAAALWAGSGAMALTGRARGRPCVGPAALALAAARWADALASLPLDVDGPALLGERAACAGGGRRGRVSVGGSARIARARDGWIAVNLPRPEDLDAIPAWLECERVAAADAWHAIEWGVRTRDVAELVQRARWLAIAVAEVARAPAVPPPPFRVATRGPARVPPQQPLVVDLSSLWAGPLCAQLLGAAGARVVKVESTRRPDGARFGDPRFFDLLNAGKQSVALDLATPDGVGALRRLLGAADVVVESARPRALRQLGIDAEALVGARGGLTWVSITGYGRDDERIAFGDDAACAAGLAWLAGAHERLPLFCADAVADPLAGLCAAAAALDACQRGGGALLDVPLRDVAAHAASVAPAPARWEGPVAAPRARASRGSARPLGADTQDVLASVAATPRNAGARREST
jgi:hypothetical protein